jgi:4-amino-4-deoxy-L-arabinose transferase-like glycosyltransferase
MGSQVFLRSVWVLTIFITYFFVKKYSSQRQAFITSLVLLASSHFLFEFRMSVPDPYLIFLNTASIFTAYSFFKEKRNYWLWLCASQWD